MADELALNDRAELMAESLGIPPASYAGRLEDAVLAMTLVASYRTLTPNDRNQVLDIIANKLQFLATNPRFFFACQGAVGLMTANPSWVPGSLSNDELEQEITFWRSAKAVLKWFGFAGEADLLKRGTDVLSKVKGVIVDADPSKPVGLRALGDPLVKGTSNYERFV